MVWAIGVFYVFPIFPCFPNVFVWPKKKQEALQILNQLGDVASLRKQSLVAHVLAKSPQALMLRVFTTFSGASFNKAAVLNVVKVILRDFP